MATIAPPVLEVAGLIKDYKGLRPLRLATLAIHHGERVAISGIDATAAEVFINLVNGAILPDQGYVRTFGQDTTAVTNETDWLASLERFGIVTPRAVLLEGATLLQNLALPITLDIDPVSADVRSRIAAIAGRVGIRPELLDERAGSVPADVRMRVHLARAVTLEPQLLLFEHPTLDVPREVVPAFAADTRRVLDEDGVTTLIVSNDDVFCGLLAHRAYRLNAASGELSSVRGWRRWFGM